MLFFCELSDSEKKKSNFFDPVIFPWHLEKKWKIEFFFETELWSSALEPYEGFWLSFFVFLHVWELLWGYIFLFGPIFIFGPVGGAQSCNFLKFLKTKKFKKKFLLLFSNWVIPSKKMDPLTAHPLALRKKIEKLKKKKLPKMGGQTCLLWTSEVEHGATSTLLCEFRGSKRVKNYAKWPEIPQIITFY